MAKLQTKWETVAKTVKLRPSGNTVFMVCRSQQINVSIH